MEQSVDKIKEYEETHPKRKRINEIGKELAGISKEEDKAVWDARWFELYSLAQQVFCPPYLPMEQQDHFQNAVISVLTSFDPKKSSLSAYIAMKMKWSEIDEYRHLYGQTKKKENDEDKTSDGTSTSGKNTLRTIISMETQVNGKNNEAVGTYEEILPDDKTDDKKPKLTDEEIIEKDLRDFDLLEIISQILNFKNKSNKNAIDKRRLKCYEIFYTSGIMNDIHMSKEGPDYFLYTDEKHRIQHLRDMVQAIVFPFIPFCMEDMDNIKIGDRGIEISFEQESYTSKISKLNKLTREELRLILQAIFDGNMRLYGQVVKGTKEESDSNGKDDKTTGIHKAKKCDPSQPIPIPMPEKVGYCFYNETSETSISYSTYSSNFKRYKEEFFMKFHEADS